MQVKEQRKNGWKKGSTGRKENGNVRNEAKRGRTEERNEKKVQWIN